eukprot:TRINITY_DN15537_c0_g1_i4.p1 TRINITY_DN15537_c0_g1~~TRINITY_DN15537_c0_g1_i4.p1  ORF type:complete len:272 (+),score=104.07 TRINITY_DN15537_c0_g1_i4:82-816(+)
MPPGAPGRQEALRWQLVQFIYACGARLRHAPSTLSLAAVLFHRFLAAAGWELVEPHAAAAACLFLAGKADEHFRKARDVVNVTQCVLRGEAAAPPRSDELLALKGELIANEQRVLRALEFDCSAPSPQPWLYNIAVHTAPAPTGHCGGLAQLAVCVLNDSLLTDLWLRAEPRVVAAAAASVAQSLLGGGLLSAQPRWAEGVLGCSTESLAAAELCMLRTYLSPRPHWKAEHSAPTCAQRGRMGE